MEAHTAIREPQRHAYLLTFGGLLLLGGRLGDLAGHRRLFVAAVRCSRAPRRPVAWRRPAACSWPGAPCRASAARSSRPSACP
jgi:hypothetical protein